MKRWPTKPLGELVDFVGGGTPRRDRPDYWGGEIPWASVKDLQSQSLETTLETITAKGLANSASNLIPQGTVIIASRVGLGKVAINLTPVAINQDLKALTPRSSDLSPRYLLLFLLSKAEYLERTGVGATVKGLTLADYQRLDIVLPPLAEQERIVKLLDEANELRKLRAQADRRTADLIHSLFREMFGELTANQKGWPLYTLAELVKDGPQNGLYKHSSFYGDGTPILRIDSFYDGEVNDMTLLKRLHATPEEISRYGLRKHDIVINRVNSPEYLGKSALIPALVEQTVFESNMMRFSVEPTQVEPGYLIRFLQTRVATSHILGRAKHSINQSSINQEDVKSMPVPLPPLSLQKEFAARVSDIRAMQAEQAASRRRLEDLFHSMLHRTFQGAL